MRNRNNIEELVGKLNKARYSYYNDNTEIMSNKEYDGLYDNLVKLETKTNIIYTNSPTQQVGYEVKSKLVKVEHSKTMLSLEKTKDIDNLKGFLGNKEGLLSLKLDGLTIVLKYDKGNLISGTTRGNGSIGEDITHNVKTFTNIPLAIPFQGKLELRGEGVITYSQFETINELISIDEDKYKNPRNLCSGTVRQLDNKICQQRKVQWHCFELIECEGKTFTTKVEQFQFCFAQGFSAVNFIEVTADTLKNNITIFEDNLKVGLSDIPSDGLVLTFNDIAYSNSLSITSHHPLHSKAFKFEDACIETTLLSVEWNTSRTGTINPVAIFTPVEIEGSTVGRASLHNLSIISGLQLGIGDTITVFKANLIIPQVDENLTCSNTLEIPETCPACGSIAEIRKTKTSEILICPNTNCGAKLLGKFTHFVSRECMNIEGLSEATLEKLVNKGLIKSFVDVYNLSEHKDIIIKMGSFGEKSYEGLISSIENSKNVKLPNFIKALGIDFIGGSVGKLIAKYYDYDEIKIFSNLGDKKKELYSIDGMGDVKANSFSNYVDNISEEDTLLLELMHFNKPQKSNNQLLLNKVFVITGSLVMFENRNALVAKIESLGGKSSGGVSAKTSYLINNEVTSTSGKNKKAQDLNIPVISEENFLTLIGE